MVGSAQNPLEAPAPRNGQGRPAPASCSAWAPTRASPSASKSTKDWGPGVVFPSRIHFFLLHGKAGGGVHEGHILAGAAHPSPCSWRQHGQGVLLVRGGQSCHQGTQTSRGSSNHPISLELLELCVGGCCTPPGVLARGVMSAARSQPTCSHGPCRAVTWSHLENGKPTPKAHLSVGSWSPQ